MTSQTHHLLTLWNPSYAADAMDEHLGVLLEWAGRWRSQFADFWFRLWDIRRLVADDTPAVIEELKRLRNTRYHDRPVSLYGGMVELPLIVTRPDEVSWFRDREEGGPLLGRRGGSSGREGLPSLGVEPQAQGAHDLQDGVQVGVPIDG